VDGPTGTADDDSDAPLASPEGHPSDSEVRGDTIPKPGARGQSKRGRRNTVVYRRTAEAGSADWSIDHWLTQASARVSAVHFARHFSRRCRSFWRAPDGAPGDSRQSTVQLHQYM